MIVCRQVNHLDFQPVINHQVSLAFRLFEIDKSSTDLSGCGIRQGVFTCVGWQVTV